MRNILMTVLISLAVVNLVGCSREDINNQETPVHIEGDDNIFNDEDSILKENMNLKIIVDSIIFTATLHNNETVTAFKNLLPMTITMSEFNNNEKYYNLSNSLPSNASNVGMIQSGELMLYGSQTLVLFYKSFSTSYSYTPLAKVDDSVELASVLGMTSVTVTFELERND